MTNKDLIQALRALCVETGSLACLGCGYEHDCGIHGCAIIQAAADRLAAYEDTGQEPEDIKKVFNEDAVVKLAAQALGTTPDCLRKLVKAQDEGLIQPISCAECRYDQNTSPREHKAHCMRCIRNRYPDDHYDRAEAEAALEKENRPN